MASSIEKLDKVVDDLLARIATDKKVVSKALDKIIELRQRIARNSTIRTANNKRLEE